MMLRLRFRPRQAATRHVCKACESRRALFRQQGMAKWDPYYALCFQCFRRQQDRPRTATAVGNPASARPQVPESAAVA